MKDIEKKRLTDFEAQIRNEKPEEDHNPNLIRELAMIRYNYYLTTFKEVFNDVIEERKHILKEQGSGVYSPSDAIKPTQYQTDIRQMSGKRPQRSQQSSQIINSRFIHNSHGRDRSTGSKVGGTAGANPILQSSAISTSASVLALPTKAVLLTEND